MQGTIHVSVVSGAADMRSYLRLSGTLPDQRPNRVPLLRMDEREFHDPKRNPQLAHCEVRYWLARRDGVVVGRIMGIIHRQHNQTRGELTARFYDLVCIRGRTTVMALLEAVEHWAKGAGMDRIIGPFGFSDKDPQGLQIVVEGLKIRRPERIGRD